MDTSTTSTPYLLGHDDAEMARLQEQARQLAPATEVLLTLGGIGAGMRVLDLGTGAGDVAFAVARRVGPAGSVVGVDASPAAVATARQRADRNKVGNVSFLSADLHVLDPSTELGGPFDAVVGRLVLLYLDDAAEVVRRCARALRPGCVLLAMEYDMTSAGSVPDTPLAAGATEWIVAAFARAGHDPGLGAHLAGMLSAAGLPDPACLGVQAYLAPNDPGGPRLLASIVRTLLPAIERAGIATAGEVGIDTLERRLQAELSEISAVVRPPALVGAWARTAA